MMPRIRVGKTAVLLSTVFVSALLFLTFTSDQRSALRADTNRHITSARVAAAGHDRHEIERAPEPEPEPEHGGPWSNPQVPIADTSLRFAADGLVYGFGQGQHAAAKAVRDELHPIIELMERGRRRWESLLKRQSKTLDHAVTEYKKRYNRLPPRGFDRWFQFCKEHNVKIIDDYDQIERDIGPWLGIAPAEFRKRVDDLESMKHSYKITLSPNKPAVMTGDRAEFRRPDDQLSLYEPLAAYLDQEITMYGSDHDTGSSIIPDDLRNALLNAAAKGTYLSEDELKQYETPHDGGLGLLSACDPSSPARLLNISQPIAAADAAIAMADNSTSFLYDPKPGRSYCTTPSLMRYHGAFSFPFRRSAVMRPVFQYSKYAQNHDFVVTPLEAYVNKSSPRGREETSTWEEKTIDKLFWRGSTTGDWYTQPKKARPNYDWRMSQRPRMHLLAQNTAGDRYVWVRRGKGWMRELWSNEELNERYLDVGAAGRVHQCDNDGTCEEMAKELIFKPRVDPHEAIKYKYVLDMDGNGWSSRFHRLLASGSVVVKSTIYPEWNSDWTTPWVHYVPAKIDYSDLYDIMSFFAGAPDDPATNHDDLARQISENARKFTLDHWRWEDMQAYMLRLMLEYARLGADDRDAHSYHK